MIVCAVDPGSVKLGYGVIRCSANRKEYVAAGTISAPAGWPVWRRLVELADGLEEVCRDVQKWREPDEPVMCAIEAGFVKGQQGALTSGAARGISMLILGRAFGAEVRQYAPASVKLAATGHGNAEKDHVAMMVRASLGMKSEPTHDAADALAVAICRAQDPA